MNASDTIPVPSRPSRMPDVRAHAARSHRPRAGLRGVVAGLTMLGVASATLPDAKAADPVVGAVIGAGAGAIIGHAVGGRDGAVVGGALGAATGAAVSSRRSAYYSSHPAVVVPAPAVTRVHYSGPDRWVGPYPPPHRPGGTWRQYLDEWGATFWVWEPVVVYAPPPPVYPVPAYPVYGTPMPPYQPPIWVPPRHAAPVHRPPPIYHPAPVYRPAPGYRPAPVYGPAPVYRPGPGHGHPPAYRAPSGGGHHGPSTGPGHGHGNGHGAGRYR